MHVATDACVHMHCFFHDVDEMTTDNTYRVCFECGHVYETAADLLREHNAAMRELERQFPDTIQMTVHISADDIFDCAFCVHDF